MTNPSKAVISKGKRQSTPLTRLIILLSGRFTDMHSAMTATIFLGFCLGSKLNVFSFGFHILLDPQSNQGRESQRRFWWETEINLGATWKADLIEHFSTTDASSFWLTPAARFNWLFHILSVYTGIFEAEEVIPLWSFDPLIPSPVRFVNYAWFDNQDFKARPNHSPKYTRH